MSPHELEVSSIQEQLIREGAVLMYFRDAEPGGRRFSLLQKAAVLGFFAGDEWNARLDEPLDRETAGRWISLSGTELTVDSAVGMTRGEFLEGVME